MSEGWQLQISLHNWTNVGKNVPTSTVRRLHEARFCGRITVKKLLRKQNNVKRLHLAQAHKDWTIEQWNKVFSTDKSKFKIFWSKNRVYERRRVGERAVTPCITPTVKYGRDSVMVFGAFAICKTVDLHQVKGKLDQTDYHNSFTQSRLQCGLWLKDIYSSKIMTKSILINSNRGTLKVNRNSTSFKLSWPAQSADSIPIELVWNELDRKVRV